jgi:hypothetical protein
VENNQFTVYGDNCEFFWVVHGKRSNIEVEPLKNSVTVKGDGPYKYISTFGKSGAKSVATESVQSVVTNCQSVMNSFLYASATPN